MTISSNVTLTPASPSVPGVPVPVSPPAEHEILGRIVEAFELLDRDAQQRVAVWVADRYAAIQ
jgi:hypothetical protein